MEDKTWQAMIKARGHQNPPLRPRSRTAGFWGAIMGAKNLTTLAHFILSPRPTPRMKEWPRMNKESPNSLETLPRTILFSAFQIQERKNGTPSKAASQSAPRKRTSTVGHPWGYSVGAIQWETVTSTLNAPNQRSGRINEEMTPKQCGLGCRNSQRVWEGGWWDEHSSNDLHDQQMKG